MMILKKEYFTEDEARAFLKLFTGQNYVFAQGNCRKWGSEVADVTYRIWKAQLYLVDNC